jgi:hypothetical protein
VDNPSYYGARFTPVGWNQYLTPAQNETDSLTQLMSTQSFVGTLGDRLFASGAVTNNAELRQVLGSVYLTLKVKAVGSHLMSISVTCDRRPVCVAVLTEAITLFREQETKLQQDQADLGISFLSTEMTRAQASLKVAQDSLSKYLADHPALKPDANFAATDPALARLMADVQQKQSAANDLQVSLSQAQYLGSVSTRIDQMGPRVIDAPHISNAGLLGDGSSLKRALLYSALCLAVGGAYLMLMTWVDKSARDAKELERRLKVRVVTTIDKMRQVEHLGS